MKLLLNVFFLFIISISLFDCSSASKKKKTTLITANAEGENNQQRAESLDKIRVQVVQKQANIQALQQQKEEIDKVIDTEQKELEKVSLLYKEMLELELQSIQPEENQPEGKPESKEPEKKETEEKPTEKKKEETVQKVVPEKPQIQEKPAIPEKKEEKPQSQETKTTEKTSDPFDLDLPESGMKGKKIIFKPIEPKTELPKKEERQIKVVPADKVNPRKFCIDACQSRFTACEATCEDTDVSCLQDCGKQAKDCVKACNF
ncbi:MAG: hypothetical protein H7A25_16390 [Leptospiraceae bacterium]|nr:hypothetical protein [Leptospiraceae bacterium]MCP5501482.1 hypothetical protein [Leptospiraceae bacterium]